MLTRWLSRATPTKRTTIRVAIATVFAVGWMSLPSAADGIPTGETLFYSGVLEEDGAPVDGTRNVELRFFDDATAGTERCSTSATAEFDEGRFRVPLNTGCTDAVRAEPDLWAQIQIGTDAPFPRTKLGAVPYAVEAESTQQAATTGPLRTELDGLQQRAPGRYCGRSTSTTTGDAGGYGAISSLCATAAGCGANARICLPGEIVLSEVAGIDTRGPVAWLATAEPQGSNECSAFTSADSSRTALIWGGSPGFRSCNSSLPVVCCE